MASLCPFLPQTSCVSQLLRDHMSSNVIRPDINTRTWILSAVWNERPLTESSIRQPSASDCTFMDDSIENEAWDAESGLLYHSGTQKRGVSVILPPSSQYCHLGPWWRVQPGVNTDFTGRGRKPCRTAPFLLQAAQVAVSRQDEMFSPTDVMPPSSESWNELKTCPGPHRDCYLGWEFTHMTTPDEKQAPASRWHPHVTLWSGSLSTYRNVMVPAALSLVGLTCQRRQTTPCHHIYGGHTERHWM